MKPPSTGTVAAAVGGVVVAVGGLLTVLWLLIDGGSPQAPTQLELVRVGLTVLLGTGGLFGLWLAWRRQRSTEIALQQKERDQTDVARAYALQERTALASEADAAARRITDLYTKAVEQLGSDKAPSAWAGSTPSNASPKTTPTSGKPSSTSSAPTCACPTPPPATHPKPTTPRTRGPQELIAEHREQVQEREVRLAAQRILAHHLNPGDDTDRPVKTFWAHIDLDLTGATLIDLDLDYCTIHTAQFVRATFTGDAWFNWATFTDIAGFLGATFTRDASFVGATFTGYALFDGATFTGDAGFDKATFTRNAEFGGATFTGDAKFGEATFTRNAEFGGATFTGDAEFGGATFTGDAKFGGATFTGDARFAGASLPSTRYRGHPTPSPWTNFSDARFERGVSAEVARFVSAPSAGMLRAPEPTRFRPGDNALYHPVRSWAPPASRSRAAAHRPDVAAVLGSGRFPARWCRSAGVVASPVAGGGFGVAAWSGCATVRWRS
ncbi:pentapeptide repeat-containing protein [Actinokineospora soli]|uniref:Pentapeptide repeat-containing protein n=1 Tax=Actinokineospora soli TaxID=1048753 RepID=A0ABW2TVP7_9PSEU